MKIKLQHYLCDRNYEEDCKYYTLNKLGGGINYPKICKYAFHELCIRKIARTNGLLTSENYNKYKKEEVFITIDEYKELKSYLVKI